MYESKNLSFFEHVFPYKEKDSTELESPSELTEAPKSQVEEPDDAYESEEWS